MNLSISLAGGRETNREGLSSGEREDLSPTPNPAGPVIRRKCGALCRRNRSGVPKGAGTYHRGERSSRAVHR